MPGASGTFRFSRLFSETRFTSQLKRQTKSQYEAFALGEVGKEAYLAAKASLRQKEETLSEQIAKLEGCKRQAIQCTVQTALNNLKKILK